MVQYKNRLICADTLNTLGTAITWSGLPMFAFLSTGSYFFTGALYFTGTIAGILVGAFGSQLIDRYSPKKVTLTALMLNIIVVLLLYLGLTKEYFVLLIPVTIISQYLGALTSLSQKTWYNSLYKKDNLLKLMGQRSGWIVTAKTLGFTLGPLIFTTLNTNAILIDALSFFICFVCLINIPIKDALPKKDEKNRKKRPFEGLKALAFNSNVRPFSIIFFLEGMIMPIIMSTSIYALTKEFHFDSRDITLFWLIGGIGSILSNYFLVGSKLFTKNIFKGLFISGTLMSLGILIMTFTSNSVVYLCSFSFVTLTSPLLSTLSEKEAFIRIPDGDQAKTLGGLLSLSQIGTLLIMLISTLIVENFGYQSLFLLISMIAVIRFVVLIYVMKNEYLQNQQKYKLN
ncbi:MULTISPECIES: MFS transporter [Bacillus cereus group]|uniref:MFS transporter n=1 Tax=Bacillus cereus TaxID=1396 RepID=A0A2B1CTM1_BACCE|nr:MFS transporter [Bacillus cereus]PDY73866.1 hypothetical protein CON06_31905 [Bacillus cereus]PFA00603.1 hypothetical protein CN382_31530 [Bacillus cereus]PFM30036.1 hypothetical protein COJ43_29440 [Bacillus cereus]PGQ04270.1 hypothetical protein COA08_30900 [Bacillus cereus]